MNLNQFDRAAFVQAVMDDVPMVDYEAMAHKKARDAVTAMTPKLVLDCAKKHPEYFTSSQVSIPRFSDISVARPYDGYYILRDKAPDVWAELLELGKLHKAQGEAREALEIKLRTVIGSCRTLKQAKERLPEFEKYLPEDRDSTGATNLPVANLVADLTAAGWPKGEAPAKGAQ